MDNKQRFWIQTDARSFLIHQQKKKKEDLQAQNHLSPHDLACSQILESISKKCCSELDFFFGCWFLDIQKNEYEIRAPIRFEIESQIFKIKGFTRENCCKTGKCNELNGTTKIKNYRRTERQTCIFFCKKRGGEIRQNNSARETAARSLSRTQLIPLLLDWNSDF